MNFVRKTISLIMCGIILSLSCLTASAQGYKTPIKNSEPLVLNESVSLSPDSSNKNSSTEATESKENSSDSKEENPARTEKPLKLNSQGQVDEELQYLNNNAYQTYVTEDNKVHTIYWAKGVKPPKMTSDKKKLGKPGYFEKDATITPKLTNITYQIPVTTGMGYYDLNKSIAKEKIMCYLASASNLVYWWMEQNKSYIDEYVAGIKSGKYIQTEGLADINSLDWENLRKAPQIVNWNGYNQQLLKDSSLSKGPFKTNYYARTDDGYFMDPVFDFFINGYRAIHPLLGSGMAPINKPDMFEKDANGGLFYPVFSNKVLSERHETSKFSYFSDRMKNWLLEGKGISLAYYVNANLAHAITVWGVEYDENGQVCRAYVTDSDDFMNTSTVDYNTVRGLHGMNLKNVDGIMYIGNNEGATAGNGNMIQLMSTLSLGQDIWEAVTNDSDPLPKKPSIKENPVGRAYGFGARADALSVKAELPIADEKKGAYLEYQWFKATDKNSVGEPIKDATKSTYTPIINNVSGSEFYYCQVSNVKYGHKNTVKSEAAEIKTINSAVNNAALPNVKFNSSVETIPQFSTYVLKAEVLNIEEMGNVTYQWYSATNNTDGGYISPIKNATSPNLTVVPETQQDLYYFCEVKNTDTGEDITGLTTSTVKTKIKRLKISAPMDITANEGSGIIIDYKNSFVEGVAENSTVESLKNNLQYNGLIVEYFSKNGEALSDSSIIGTGTVIRVKSSVTFEILNEKTVIVYGDITGDGKITTEDYAESSKITLGEKVYTEKELYLKRANDINFDGVIDVLDTMLIKRSVKK